MSINQREPNRHAAKINWLGSLWCKLIGFALVAITFASAPASAASEVQGDLADMQLLVDNASTKEVLHALSTSFGLVYSLPANVGRNTSGAYSGTLRQVLARILDGTDYILKVSDSTVEVVVLGASGVATVASADPPIARKTTVVPAALSSKAPPPLASYLTGNGPGRTP